MLMVIFGAGASYDSCPTYPPGTPVHAKPDILNDYHRPPLANQLFANRPVFAEVIERFPECQPIVPRLRSLRGETLEAVLEDLQTKAESYPRGFRQLVAVRCYLHQVITASEMSWRGVAKGVTNYKSLLDQIERGHNINQPVCLATFNYDTLLEDALRDFDLPITSIDDYTKKHPFYRVFKLHGSINWTRDIEIQTPIENRLNTDTILRELIERAAEIRITDRYIFSGYNPVGALEGKPAFPAIAIPVETKRSFECPAEMLEGLVELLPFVSKLLIIGWRATEAHFLSLLKTNLRRGVQLYIVAGSDQNEAEDIKVRINRALLNNPPSSSSVDPGGFTDFMLHRRAAQFLGN